MQSLSLRLCAALILGIAASPGACKTAQPVSVSPLEETIRGLIADYPDGVVAVAVRDASTGRSVDIESDRIFHAASTMKVPVMIEVYRQASLGRFQLSSEIEVNNSFRSIVDDTPYRIEDDSDDEIYEHLGEDLPISELVYQMITVSSNLAANLLIDFVSADSVQSTIERLGTRHMKVLRGVEDIKAYSLGLNNTATAADLALLLELLQSGEAVSERADAAMIDVLLDQVFNEMIPAGLPEGIDVAHKSGWTSTVNHDAAIVYPLRGAPYVLVVMTEGLGDEKASRLTADISRAVYEHLRG